VRFHAGNLLDNPIRWKFIPRNGSLFSECIRHLAGTTRHCQRAGRRGSSIERSIFVSLIDLFSFRAALPSNQRNSLLRAKKGRGAAIHFHFRPQLSTLAARSTEVSSSSPIPGNATEDKREKREDAAKGVIALSCAARCSDMRANANGNILSVALISEISESPRLLPFSLPQLRRPRLSLGLPLHSTCTLLSFSRSREQIFALRRVRVMITPRCYARMLHKRRAVAVTFTPRYLLSGRPRQNTHYRMG